MPRENRKRGKKHKKEKTEDEYVEARAMNSLMRKK